MKDQTPFYIVSYFTFSDKKTLVGGLRPFYLYQKMIQKGFNVKLITPFSDSNLEIVVKEGSFIQFIKPLLRIFPPDLSIAWSIKVFFYLKKHNANNKFILFTTAPPHGLGLIGLLSKFFLKNVVWISDYRDLWTKNPLYKPIITKRIMDPILEKQFHKKSDLVVLNTHWDLELHRRLYPLINNKSLFVRNGFNKLLTNKSIDNYKFIYAGGTTKGQATIRIIQLLEEINSLGIKCSCDFYGEYDANMENSPYVKYHGSIESDKVAELLTNYKFGFIYLPVGCETGGRMAQKFYDYIGSGVIPICFRASIEMKKIMDDLNTGMSIYDDTITKSVVKFIKTAEFNADNDMRNIYTRDNQFNILVEQIERLIK